MAKPLNVHALFLEIFSLYVTLLPRDQYLLQIIQFILKFFTQHWLISPCHKVLTNRMFMVRLLISFEFKVSLCVENVYVFLLLGHVTRWIHLISESRMKLTWHYSEFAIEKLDFSTALKYYSFIYIFIHGGAVGMRGLGVRLLCS